MVDIGQLPLLVILSNLCTHVMLFKKYYFFGCAGS